MRSGNTIIFNSEIKATEDNLDGAIKKFDQAMKDAPKPGDYPGMNVVVSHKLEITGETITLDKNTDISALLKKFGIQQAKSETNPSTELSKTDEATLTFKIT